MSEELHPDIVWEERIDRMTRLVSEGFPELGPAAIIKVMEDWMEANSGISAQLYIRHCFERALQMFELEESMGRQAEDFVDFIRPALELFFGHPELSDPTLLGLVRELLDL